MVHAPIRGSRCYRCEPPAGPNVVVDVLEGEMQQLLRDEFIPQVMANEQVEKWAHYARYERRFLGKNVLQTLNCTSRWPVPFRTIACRSRASALLRLWNTFSIKRSIRPFKKLTGAVRPLSQAHLEYAASDTEWCYGVYHHLRDIPQRARSIRR